MSSIEKGENYESREMRGGGFYTQSTKGCFDVIANGKPNCFTALQSCDLAGEGPICIADYGTADGGTSMYLMRDLIAEIRKTNPSKEILLLYEDQPTNDFKPLFLMTQGLMDGPPSFLKEFPDGVYVHACGTSFYEKCAPKGTIQLGFSATAMHWLRTTPGKIKAALHSAMATPEERAVFAEQAAKDWQLNMLCRAHELSSGGRLVFINFCTDGKGRYLGNTGPSTGGDGPSVSMHATFSRLWKTMADEGKITQEEYENTNFPQHYRTVEEYIACFKDESSPVYKAGLRLDSCETKVTPCPYRANWLAGKYTSPEAFAEDFIPTLRSWSSGVFLTGLSDTRSAEERQALVNEFYNRYKSEVVANPDQHGMDYVHAYIVARKA